MTELQAVKFIAYKKAVLPDLIVEDILNMIKDGQLAPGEKLPSERDLAAQMQVGRPTVRSALRALASMNVIDIRPGSGAYISSLSAESLVKHLEFVYFLDPTSISQLYETRRTLELSAIALAAERIRDDELMEMERCLESMATADADGRHSDAYALDRAFHKMIATASRNPLLAQFISVVAELVSMEYRKKIMQMRGTVTTPTEDHRVILNALKKRDPEAAQSAMFIHLAHSEEGHRTLAANEVADN